MVDGSQSYGVSKFNSMEVFFLIPFLNQPHNLTSVHAIAFLSNIVLIGGLRKELKRKGKQKHKKKFLFWKQLLGFGNYNTHTLEKYTVSPPNLEIVPNYYESVREICVFNATSFIVSDVSNYLQFVSYDGVVTNRIWIGGSANVIVPTLNVGDLLSKKLKRKVKENDPNLIFDAFFF